MLYGFSYYFQLPAGAGAHHSMLCKCITCNRIHTHTKTDLYMPSCWPGAVQFHQHLAGTPGLPVYALGAGGRGQLRLLEMDAGDQRGTQFQAAFCNCYGRRITVKMCFAAYGGGWRCCHGSLSVLKNAQHYQKQ
jgi:hypothetical protein